MTLVEFMFALGIGALVMAAVAGVLLFTGRHFAILVNYFELEGQSRKALDTLIRDVRSASSLTSFTTNSLTFRDYDSNTLVFAYSPTDRVFTKTKDGVSQTLLRECDSLRFSIFQRTPLAGSFDQYTTTNADACKVVQVSWTCARTITGTKLTTESVQTAKIVIRNH